MKRLPEEIGKNGFRYCLVKRNDKAAIYAQHERKTDNIVAYECMRIVTAKPSKLPDGSIAPEREVFPGNGVFGRWAWTYPKIELAEKKFKEITDEPAKTT